MRPEDIQNKRILISPLNWGMGHVARCIPLIHQFIRQENKIFVACNREQETIFHSYFPDLTYIAHEGYPFSFKGKGNFEKDLFFSFFKLKKRLKEEKKEVEKMVIDHQVNIILSDHRYGFISSKCHSVFLTHQLNLPVTGLSGFVDKIHKKLIRSFDETWVLDTPTSQFAGALSQNKGLKNVEYIGIRSRFSLYPKTEKTIPVVVIISGPKPYTEQFFRDEFKRTESKDEKTVFIVPYLYFLEKENKKLELILSSDWKKADEVILKAAKIISRSGYSTIMDLAVLQVEAELIPTPGQKEQEYLNEFRIKQQFINTLTTE